MCMCVYVSRGSRLIIFDLVKLPGTVLFFFLSECTEFPVVGTVGPHCSCLTQL